MTQRSLAEVLIAVTGLYMLLSAPPMLVFGFEQLFNQASFLPMFASFVVHVVLGTGLIVFRSRLAQWLFTPSEALSLRSTTLELQAALFAVVGVYFTIQGVSHQVAGVVMSEYQWSLGVGPKPPRPEKTSALEAMGRPVLCRTCALIVADCGAHCQLDRAALYQYHLFCMRFGREETAAQGTVQMLAMWVYSQCLLMGQCQCVAATVLKRLLCHQIPRQVLERKRRHRFGRQSHLLKRTGKRLTHCSASFWETRSQLLLGARFFVCNDGVFFRTHFFSNPRAFA